MQRLNVFEIVGHIIAEYCENFSVLKRLNKRICALIANVPFHGIINLKKQDFWNLRLLMQVRRHAVNLSICDTPYPLYISDENFPHLKCLIASYCEVEVESKKINQLFFRNGTVKLVGSFPQLSHITFDKIAEIEFINSAPNLRSIVVSECISLVLRSYPKAILYIDNSVIRRSNSGIKEFREIHSRSFNAAESLYTLGFYSRYWEFSDWEDGTMFGEYVGAQAAIIDYEKETCKVIVRKRKHRPE